MKEGSVVFRHVEFRVLTSLASNSTYVHVPANGNLAGGRTCVASAEGNNGWACCDCGVGIADALKGVEVAVAVDEVFERRESEYILLVGSRKPPEDGNLN